MSDAELSRDLALALGYAPESVRIDTDARGIFTPVCKVYRITNDMGPYWRHFDYRDPSVCLPLIDFLIREHDAMVWHGMGKGYVIDVDDEWMDEATLAEAVARAVIAVRKG